MSIRRIHVCRISYPKYSKDKHRPLSEPHFQGRTAVFLISSFFRKNFLIDFIYFLEAGHILVTIPCYSIKCSKNTYQYFIHNTRGLPGGSPHSLVFTGFLRRWEDPFFMPILAGLPEIYQIWWKEVKPSRRFSEKLFIDEFNECIIKRR